MGPQQCLATLNHLFFHNLEGFRQEALLRPGAPEAGESYSTEQFGHAVLALARYLKSCPDLVEGGRVAVLSENRPEWHIADFAILLARMVVVPVYIELPASQICTLLEHSGCSAIVVSGSRRRAVLRELLPGLPELRRIIAVDSLGEGDRADATLAGIVSATPPLDANEVRRVRSEALSLDPETIATLVYTSGTTGAQKGVMLSHRNVMFDLERCVDRLGFRTTRQALSVLPLSHAFERLLCYGYFRMGIPIAYGDPHDLKALLARHRPSVMGCVPRILEKVQETVQSQVRRQPLWKQRLFESLMRIGLVATRRRGPRKRLSIKRRAQYRCADALLFRRIRRQLGGIEYMVCGGAWLNPGAEEFFRAIGIVVLQGYGLTETSPVVCLNRLGGEKSGAVGPPLDGVEVRIAENGEVLTRGPHVMKGYYRDAQSTAQVICDGWLATGDLGRFDDEGNLTITGRIKELIVLSTGKNVSPASAEEALLRSRLVQNVFGVGDGRKFLTALIVPHRSNVEEAARSRNISCSNFDVLLQSPEIMALFQAELAGYQTELAPFERVKRFSFLGENALLDPELVTPTQKVRRKVLERRYAESIDKMYAQENEPS